MATKKAFQGENYKKSGEYVGNYNGGRSEVQEIASTLKRRNVRAMAGNSSYIGKRVLLIHNNDLEKAVKAMKEFYPKHYATDLLANLKRDVDTDKKMGVFESNSYEMKNLSTFEGYAFNKDGKKVKVGIPTKEQEQVDYYIEKFATKMDGTTRQSAAWWVDGITELSDDAKRAVWAGIQQHIPKRPFPLNKSDLPEWANESVVNEWGDPKSPSKQEVTEMANIVYDTLMNNKQNIQFDTEKVSDQSIENNQIEFVYNGVQYKITVSKGGGFFS